MNKPIKIKAKNLRYGMYLLRLKGRVLETAPAGDGRFAVRYGSNDTYSGQAWSWDIDLDPNGPIWIMPD